MPGVQKPAQTITYEKALSQPGILLDERTTLRPMHVDHCLLDRMHAAFNRSNTFDRGNVTSVSRQNRHQARVNREVPDVGMTV